jgi:alpha-N-arabinofuranosidase
MMREQRGLVRLGILLILANWSLAFGEANTPALTLDLSTPGKTVSPTFFGLMTEEINHSYDGGLYAELIRNRAFLDDPKAPANWSVKTTAGCTGTIALDQTDPVNTALPNSLRLDVTKTDGGPVGISNDGFWGVPVKPDTTYRVSFFAKAKEVATEPLTVGIENDDAATGYPTAQTENLSTQWHRYTITLKTGENLQPSKKNHFVISSTKPGTYWFSLVSMMPPTWHDRPNGCRIDLMQLMADLKPAFLRCPGGNYLEGQTIEDRFNWKTTIGDISQRPGHESPWGYRSTDGMGLLEFLEWSEDIGAEPVLAVYAGYSLSSREHKEGIAIPAGAELKPYVDEAVEEIEYAIGDASTKWGARRAADGHPAPFHLQYVEIGNEDFNTLARRTHEARFAQFYDALKAAYPHLKYIATIPVKDRTPDAIDDHYYKTSDQMAGLAHKYDNTDRNGPKVFVGEWATREIRKVDRNGKVSYVMMPWAYKGGPTPTFHAALGDAAFMTGLERNADIVVMNCYAPMLTRIDPGAAQWCPNMIGYDALSSYASPSYYVQQMFNKNLGDVIVNLTPSQTPDEIFYSATRSSKIGTIYLKVVNRSSTAVPIQINLGGAKTVSPDGEMIQITADPQAANSIEEPKKVVPVTTKLHELSAHFTQTFAGNSLTVLKIEK